MGQAEASFKLKLLETPNPYLVIGVGQASCPDFDAGVCMSVGTDVDRPAASGGGRYWIGWSASSGTPSTVFTEDSLSADGTLNLKWGTYYLVYSNRNVRGSNRGWLNLVTTCPTTRMWTKGTYGYMRYVANTSTYTIVLLPE